MQPLCINWFRSSTLLAPPPKHCYCSEAFPVAIQGSPGEKCDLRHAGRHAGTESVKPVADRPSGTQWECTGQQCGGVEDEMQPCGCWAMLGAAIAQQDSQHRCAGDERARRDGVMHIPPQMHH